MSTEPMNDRRKMERKNYEEVCKKRGICPDTGETIKECVASDMCDCKEAFIARDKEKK